MRIVISPPSTQYLKWLNRFSLRPIKTEEQNELALQVLVELQHLANRNKLADDEYDYMHVLGMLIKEFERKTYDFGPGLSPGEMLGYLMCENNVEKQDLVPEIFSSLAEVDEVLTGKKEINQDRAEKAAKRFHVSPRVFCRHCPCVRQ